MQMRLLILLLLSGSLFGQSQVQFSNLATTSDGSVLYVSSPLMLRGDNESPNQKIFRIDASGITVVEQFARDASPGVPFANFYNAIQPDVSGDGKIFSYVASRTCLGGSSCLFVELYQSHVTGAGPEIVYTGKTHLSRNGRYALRYGSTGLPMQSDPVPALIDLTTGTRTPLSGQVPEGREVASDGSVLLLADGNLSVWKAGTSRMLPSQYPQRAVLSDNAAVVAVEMQLTGGQEQLSLYDVASGRQTVIVAQSPSAFSASLTDDGQRLCYLNGGQVYLYDRATGSSAALNSTPESVDEAVISGDGSTVWEATSFGRILKVDAVTGAAREAVPRTPLMTSVEGAPVPGSLNWLYGRGLSEAATAAQPPLADFLDGYTVLLNGMPMRMLSVSPGLFEYQVPFELPTGAYNLSIAPNPSPFDPPPQQVELTDYAPVAAAPQTSTGGCCDEFAIAHADFSALVTQANPALPGEVVHAYFTGLGPVMPALPSGVAAPLDRTSPVVRLPSCTYYQSPGVTAPGEILFAGMAPGLVGVYQVELRLPQSVSGLSNNPSQTSVFYSCDDQWFSVWMDFSGKTALTPHSF